MRGSTLRGSRPLRCVECQLPLQMKLCCAMNNAYDSGGTVRTVGMYWPWSSMGYQCRVHHRDLMLI